MAGQNIARLEIQTGKQGLSQGDASSHYGSKK